MIVSRIAVTLLAALLAAAPCIDAPSARALAPRENATNTTGLDYAPGILVVGLKEQERRDGGIDLLFGGGPGGVSSRPRLARALPNISAQIVQVDAGSEDAWLAYLRSDPRVAYAERDHRVSVAALPPGTVSHHDRGDAAGAKIPDDPFLPLQWGLAMLRMPEAWERTTGVPDVVIALVDTGLTLGHPDLVGKLWRNEGEIAGNGLDDDGNGQVDDIHGWRYYHAYSGGAYHPGEDPYIADEHGHGTHVAGIAAAATNNGIGIAGVSWGAKIMVVRALDRYGSGWYSDVAAAVIYAADNGARIINLSLGDSEPSALLCEAIHYAHSRGCLVVAAAGNSGGAVFCPATCPQALAVAASDSADRRASFSSYGPEVDLTAPGSDTYSTWPWRDGYMTLSGTSMAAAYVSGVASLVWSLWPELEPDAVAEQLMCTAVDIDAQGLDPNTGHGRIDAAAATAELCGHRRFFLPLLVRGYAAAHTEPAATTPARK